MMTQGVIIFVMGEKAPDGLQTGAHYQGLRQSTGALEVVISQSGVLELDDAWHFLRNFSCEPIHLLVTAAEPDRLRPVYPLVRLAGENRLPEKTLPASRHQGVRP
jgi:hypothetical protein